MLAAWSRWAPGTTNTIIYLKVNLSAFLSLVVSICIHSRECFPTPIGSHFRHSDTRTSYVTSHGHKRWSVVTMTSETMTHRRAMREATPPAISRIAASARRLPRSRLSAFRQFLFSIFLPPLARFWFFWKTPVDPWFMHYVCNWASARNIHVCIEYTRCMMRVRNICLSCTCVCVVRVSACAVRSYEISFDLVIPQSPAFSEVTKESKDYHEHYCQLLSVVALIFFLLIFQLS